MRNLLTSILLIASGIVAIGCSSNPVIKTNQCIGYSVTGDDVTWKPIKFYQSQSEGKLYIQLPVYANFQPELFVKDIDFDRPAGTPYTYNPSTHTFRVDDNYDEYILSRTDLDTTSTDEVHIKCNREIPITPFKDIESKESNQT